MIAPHTDLASFRTQSWCLIPTQLSTLSSAAPTADSRAAASRNVQNLRNTTRLFLESIYKAIDTLPVEVAQLATVIKQEVTPFFEPDWAVAMSGSLSFLLSFVTVSILGRETRLEGSESAQYFGVSALHLPHTGVARSVWPLCA